jgi:hypothetical protein
MAMRLLTRTLKAMIIYTAILYSLTSVESMAGPGFDLHCSADFPRLISLKVFDKYQTPYDKKRTATKPPDVTTGRARLYRTEITMLSKKGANFAGHYTILGIGCGAATICVAIVDSYTGHVFFPAKLLSIEALLVDTKGYDLKILNFRRNSRLLIVFGSPNERQGKAGAHYYIWQNNRLRLVRQVFADNLCKLPRKTQF